MMSIATNRIDSCGFARGLAGGSVVVCVSEPSDERRTDGGEISTDLISSSSTSSIGRNSDEDERSSDGEEGCKEDEAQSAYKGPLDMMESLEEVLPIRRGISNFYDGKSKSFTNLTEVSSASSMREIAKPENAYSRKRRNLMASSNLFWDKNRSKGNCINRLSKKPLNTSKSCLGLAMAMTSSSSSSGCTSEDSYSSLNSQSSPQLPPLHPRSNGSSGSFRFTLSSSPKKDFSAWKSYSMVDLAQCNAIITPECLITP